MIDEHKERLQAGVYPQSIRELEPSPANTCKLSVAWELVATKESESFTAARCR